MKTVPFEGQEYTFCDGVIYFTQSQVLPFCTQIKLNTKALVEFWAIYRVSTINWKGQVKWEGRIFGFAYLLTFTFASRP